MHLSPAEAQTAAFAAANIEWGRFPQEEPAIARFVLRVDEEFGPLDFLDDLDREHLNETIRSAERAQAAADKRLWDLAQRLYAVHSGKTLEEANEILAADADLGIRWATTARWTLEVLAPANWGVSAPLPSPVVLESVLTSQKRAEARAKLYLAWSGCDLEQIEAEGDSRGLARGMEQDPREVEKWERVRLALTQECDGMIGPRTVLNRSVAAYAAYYDCDLEQAAHDLHDDEKAGAWIGVAMIDEGTLIA